MLTSGHAASNKAVSLRNHRGEGLKCCQPERMKASYVIKLCTEICLCSLNNITL